MKQLNSFLLVILFCTVGVSQGSHISISDTEKPDNPNSPKLNGRYVIPQLHQGTLIIRLSAFPEKIEFLRKTEGDDKAMSEQDRIDQANKDLMNEFATDYNFSDVVYAYGSDLDRYLTNPKSNVFLNKDLQTDPSIQIKDGPIYILASNSSTDFKLYDTKFNPISKPSPSYVNHHLDKDYHVGIDAAAQELREFTTRNRTAAFFNKKLLFYLN